MNIDGEVAAGFENVRKVFEEGAADLGTGGGAFAAYVGSEKVVDLWGGSATTDAAWTSDTRAILMSATKGLVALCAHILFDREQLDVDAPVATYWPGFARNGKRAITVRQVLNHSSGVIGVPGHEPDLGFDGSGWSDYETIAAWLEEAPPAWEPGTLHGYHAVTFGWLIGELIHRIDGRRLGRFFHDEIARPLGLAITIGTPLERQGDIASVIQASREERASEMELILGALPEEVRAPVMEVMVGARDPSKPPGMAFLARDDESVLDNLATLMNAPAARAAEIGATGGASTARDLARVYAMLANGGILEGARIVSQSSIEVFASPLEPVRDQVLGLPACFALGYSGNWGLPGTPRRFGPSDHAFGHAGAGGQVGYCDPDRRLAVGFVRSQLTMMPVFFTALQNTLYECLDQQDERTIA